MTKKLVIRTDVEDWHQEYQKVEPTLKDDDEIIAFMMEGHNSTALAARMVIVARELDFSPADIIKPNKLLLMFGAQDEINTKVKRARHTAIMPNGEEYEVRTYIGTRFSPDDESEGGTPYVDAESDAGVKLARRYLEKVVGGHIFERFKQIAIRNGNLLQAAEMLHTMIDEMVAKLTEPRSP